jgi:large subunit ribosomal protein L7/L12
MQISAESNENDKVNKVLNMISSITLEEAAELKERMKDRFSLTYPASFVCPSENDIKELKEEKTIFNLILVSPGTEKIKCLVAIRQYLQTGLKETKDMVDNVPAVLLTDQPIEVINLFKAQLEDIGAKVRVD